MAEKSYTYSDVAEHNTKTDLFLVIHDKVYNSSKFVDEHPGGEEVLLDVGGQDATEAFEDVGHSDEAREILNGMLVGELKRQPGDPAPKTTQKAAAVPQSSGGSSIVTYVLIAGVVAVAIGLYQFQQSQQQK